MGRQRRKRDHVKKEAASPVESTTTTPVAPSWAQRRFWLVLGIMLAVALLMRIVILRDYVTSNPLADTPINDANTYWQWSEAIADGQLAQDEPFFSAPLYPYLLGLIRRLGGGLQSVYVLQMLMDLTTALLLARAGRWRFGPGTGLLSAGLFLLLMEPASFSLRVLTSSLQLVLLAWTYLQLLHVQAKPTTGRRVAAGAVIGVLCLSYPPAMVLAVAVGPWLFWQSSRRKADAWRAAIPLGVAALVIAPATIHNFAASGDLFFIQSATAINLRQGNQPQSTGGYTPIPNTHTGRERLFEDVKRLYAEDTGSQGSWSEINRYYRDQVVDFWRSSPRHTAWLVSRKVWYFLTSRNYGDIYQPVAEIEAGITRSLRLTPLPVAGLIGLAIVGLVMMLRRPVHFFPEWSLFAIPFLLVAVFWFSPRYRLPAIPVIVLAASWTLAKAVQWERHRGVSIAALAMLVISFGTGVANRARGFDLFDPGASLFQVAHAFEQQGDTEAAVAKLREGLERNPNSLAALLRLGELLAELGQPGEAIAVYERACAVKPSDESAPNRIVRLMIEQKQYGQLEAWLTEYLRTRPPDGTYLAILATAKQQLAKPDEAGALYAEAVKTDPDNVSIRLDYGAFLFQGQRLREAETQYTRAVELMPTNVKALRNLGVVLFQLGRGDAARTRFEQALDVDPNNAGTLFDLAILEFNLKRLDEAAALLERVLELEPGHKKGRAALEQIQQQRRRQATGGS